MQKSNVLFACKNWRKQTRPLARQTPVAAQSTSPGAPRLSFPAFVAQTTKAEGVTTLYKGIGAGTIRQIFYATRLVKSITNRPPLPKLVVVCSHMPKHILAKTYTSICNSLQGAWFSYSVWLRLKWAWHGSITNHKVAHIIWFDIPYGN